MYAQFELEQPPEAGPLEDPLIWTVEKNKQTRQETTEVFFFKKSGKDSKAHTQELAEEHQPQLFSAAHVEQLE